MTRVRSDIPLSFLVDTEAPLSLEVLQQELMNHSEWWDTVLSEFLLSSTAYFSKPYTIQHIKRITRHILEGKETLTYPLRVTCYPTRLEITGGFIYIDWEYDTEPAYITIPEEEDPPVQLPVLPPASTASLGGPPALKGGPPPAPPASTASLGGGPPPAPPVPLAPASTASAPAAPAPPSVLEEWDADALPEKGATTKADSTDTPLLRLYEKQRVKEAQLRAKLALYHAQAQRNHFYEKYGDEVSESEWESEWESEEDEEDASP